MADPVESVKEIISRITAIQRRTMPGADGWDRRERDLSELQALVDEVEALRLQLTPIPEEHGDLSDLPKELLDELQVVKVADLDAQIYNIIKAAGGRADIDTVLINLFRRHGDVYKRRFIQNKLWRMTQKDGLLWSDPEAKGVYLTSDPEKDDGKVFAGLTTEGLEPTRDTLDGPKHDFDLEDEIPF